MLRLIEDQSSPVAYGLGKSVIFYAENEERRRKRFYLLLEALKFLDPQRMSLAVGLGTPQIWIQIFHKHKTIIMKAAAMKYIQSKTADEYVLTEGDMRAALRA